MSRVLTDAIIDFCIAFGVVLGGSLLGGIGAVLTLQPPTSYMLMLADKIKIWALVVAVGGTIDPLRVIESNLTEGYVTPAMKQIFLIVCSFLGAQTGTELIHWICREDMNV
jgi:hypothetical protein